MPRFRYRTFLCIFAVGNTVVWCFILSGLAQLVHEHFTQADGLSPDGALAFFALTPFVSSVLAAQGAIVSLRAQYLIGRFSPPPDARTALPAPDNPWVVALRSVLPIAAVAAVVTAVVAQLVLRQALSAGTTARVMAGIGAVITMLIVFRVADREFRRFHFHLGGVGRRTSSLRPYLSTHFAMPWATVNGILNGIFAWMLYHQGPGHPDLLVSMAELRHDLVLTTFLICVFTAVATIPEVDGDFAAGVTPAATELRSMPHLLTRYGIAVGLAIAVWLAVTLWGQVTGLSDISLESTIAIKAIGGGALAGLAAAQCARWALARCRAQAAAVLVPPRRAAIA